MCVCVCARVRSDERDVAVVYLFINKNVVNTGFHYSLDSVRFCRPYCFVLRIITMRFRLLCRSRCFINYSFALHYELLVLLVLVSLGTCFFRCVMSGCPVYSHVIYSNLPLVVPQDQTSNVVEHTRILWKQLFI